MVIKIFIGLQKRVDEFSENFNKEIENIKQNQAEMENSIIEIKTLSGWAQ